MDKFFDTEAQVHLMFFYQEEDTKPDTTKHAWMQQEGGMSTLCVTLTL